MAVNERTALLNGNNHSHKNGTHIVDVPFNSSEYEEIFTDYEISSGLSLEELLPYKDDAWWKNVRRSLFVSFWLTLLLTFIVACGLSYVQIGYCKIPPNNGNILAGVANGNILMGNKQLAI